MAKKKSVEWYKLDEIKLPTIPSKWSEIVDCVNCGSQLEGSGEKRKCSNPRCRDHPKKGV